MSEVEWLALCRQQDEEGYAQLFHHYQGPAYRLALTITGDSALAEDALQEAFIQAFRSLDNLRPGAPFGPWFYAILTNKARRLARRQPWRRWLPLFAAETVVDAGAGQSLERALVKGEVWQAVDRLPVELREVVGLRYLLDLSEAEMATILGIPAGTVKSRLYRARQRLQESLAPLKRGEETLWISSTR